jgi:hypothetical protein
MKITGAKLDMKTMTMTVRISGYRQWRLRCLVAVWLCKLAARVLGTGFEVEE